MEIKEIQSLLKELLIDVESVFDNLGVNYYLAYGTLLGAKRHHGFIPWDDDVDLFVPRKDFYLLEEKYNRLAEKSFFFSTKTNSDYFFPFAKISLNSTQSKQRTHNTPRSLGVSIDIFPIDMLPSTKWKRELCFYSMKLLNRSIGTYHKEYTLCSKKDAILWIFGKVFGYKNMLVVSNRIAKSLNSKPRAWIGNLVWGSYHHADIFPTDFLGTIRKMDFEGLSLRVPEKSEALLKLWYDDYMQLPSKEEIEKCAHHFNELYECIE